MPLSHQGRGRLGNRAAVEKTPEHRREAGKRGIRSLAGHYFSGSIGEAMEWLRSRRNEYQIEALVAEKQAAMLANGRESCCEGLPVFCDADCDPSFHRDMVRDRGTGRSRAG